MRTRAPFVAVLALAASLVLPAAAEHNGDVHSPNMSLVAHFDHEQTWQAGTDIAFWGDLAVFGNLDPGGFRLMNISNPSRPRLLSTFVCVGSQSDVSMWGDLVFVSVDVAHQGDDCLAPESFAPDAVLGQAWEGVRVVSIAERAKPKQIAAIDTECGSHTHSLVPDLANNRVFLYVLSYPLTNQFLDCNWVSHRKISVIEVPLDAPEKARVVSTPSVSPAVGCHDVTAFLDRKIAAAACLSESQIWDISDPVNPVVIAHITNPFTNVHHSAGFSWDGNTMVLGDELGGAAVAPGCLGLGLPLGALWFYDVTDPTSPVERGSFNLPRDSTDFICTAHNFNVIPLADDRDVLVSAWYDGGTTVVDFTDPTNPIEIGYYLPEGGSSWSSYFYNGYIYANNLGSRGLDVFKLDERFLERRIPLPHLNAQTQERLPAATGAGSGATPPPAVSPPPAQGPEVLSGKTGNLPGTGVAPGGWPALALVLGAAVVAIRLRRA